MPICIECSYPVPQLYHVLHSRPQRAAAGAPPTVPPKPSAHSSSSTSQKDSAKSPPPAAAADERNNAKFKKGGGGGAGTAGYGSDVRLTQCPRCKRFADKYVEYDYVVLFIDLVLVKPQVYRHLLFNRLHRDDDKIDPSITRLGTLLLLFEVYITWSHVESLPQSVTSNSRITDLPIILQYCFFLFLCLATTLGQHLTVRWLAWFFGLCGTRESKDADAEREASTSQGANLGNASTATPAMPAPAPAAASSSSAPSSTQQRAAQPIPRTPSPNAISTAIFVSSCMSLFPLLMVVWKYDSSSSSSTSPPPSFSTTPAATQPQNTSTTVFSSAFLTPSLGKGVDWVRKGVSWIVALQNLEALRILLGCGYLTAGGFVVAGEVVKWALRTSILSAVGFGDVGR